MGHLPHTMLELAIPSRFLVNSATTDIWNLSTVLRVTLMFYSRSNGRSPAGVYGGRSPGCSIPQDRCPSFEPTTIHATITGFRRDSYDFLFDPFSVRLPAKKRAGIRTRLALPLG